jgi:hypothetical protein
MQWPLPTEPKIIEARNFFVQQIYCQSKCRSLVQLAGNWLAGMRAHPTPQKLD